MFYFEQLLLTALSGIDSYNITSTVLGVAGTILLLSFLYSAYQAFAMGGDVRMLAIGGITLETCRACADAGAAGVAAIRPFQQSRDLPEIVARLRAP